MCVFSSVSQVCILIHLHSPVSHIFLWRYREYVISLSRPSYAHLYYCFVIVIIIINKYCCIPFFVGETADTLNALRYCKDRGALIVGVTNTGTLILQLKKLSPLQVLYEPSKAYGAWAYLERNAPCWAMTHLQLCKLSMLFASFPQQKLTGKANRPVLCY